MQVDRETVKAWIYEAQEEYGVHCGTERIAGHVAQRAAEAERKACESLMRDKQEKHMRAATLGDENHLLAEWCGKSAIVYGRAAELIRTRSHALTKEKQG